MKNSWTILLALILILSTQACSKKDNPPPPPPAPQNVQQQSNSSIKTSFKELGEAWGQLILDVALTLTVAPIEVLLNTIEGITGTETIRSENRLYTVPAEFVDLLIRAGVKSNSIITDAHDLMSNSLIKDLTNREFRGCKGLEKTPEIKAFFCLGLYDVKKPQGQLVILFKDGSIGLNTHVNTKKYLKEGQLDILSDSKKKPYRAVDRILVTTKSTPTYTHRIDYYKE